jgi:hypothetical protein
MIPMRTSSVFKSRWMALIWAAGIIWFALDFTGSHKSAAIASNKQSMSETGPTDADGQPAGNDDDKTAADALGL